MVIRALSALSIFQASALLGIACAYTIGDPIPQAMGELVAQSARWAVACGCLTVAWVLSIDQGCKIKQPLAAVLAMVAARYLQSIVRLDSPAWVESLPTIDFAPAMLCVVGAMMRSEQEGARWVSGLRWPRDVVGRAWAAMTGMSLVAGAILWTHRDGILGSSRYESWGVWSAAAIAVLVAAAVTVREAPLTRALWQPTVVVLVMALLESAVPGWREWQTSEQVHPLAVSFVAVCLLTVPGVALIRAWRIGSGSRLVWRCR